MDTTLVLLRGLPGSGKSTLASLLSRYNVAADDYFTENGEYKFDPTQLKVAHQWCQDRTRNLLEGLMGLEAAGEDPGLVVVHNTFTQSWEMQPYLDMAKELGIRVWTIISENREGYQTVHDVPEDKILQMHRRFSVVLRPETVVG